MTIPYHQAHARIGEIHAELATLTGGEAQRAVALLDELVHCAVEMSAYQQGKYPGPVAALRTWQIAREPVVGGTPDGAA